ncbi:MaoC family dehydratase N-terminal domain-containing protein [uncultured Jatrophihabitans sp.]|uniref:FAS1-like dehydratase domain-containing protein n=1 Tax=uncultured Jatrophihabitans sp. TaxID=1610747 RepID=UPI0035CCA2EE
MPVDQSFVGRTYPPSEPYRVNREKIREFADAINDPNPAYRSVDAARALGHADIVAPPTFPIVLTMNAGNAFLFDPAAGVDFSRVVHGDQRFVHERPLVAGDKITAALTIDGIRVAGGNEIIANHTEVRTVDGELVSTAYATIVVRGPGA